MKYIRPNILMPAGPFTHNIKNCGFTLVELMIAMAVGGLIMASVMTSFLSQHRSYLAQDDVIEMQQNGRVTMDMLTRDIHSAGYDPNDLGAGITTATPTNIVFTREDDLATNGLETISFSLFDAFASAVPPSNDGLNDDLAIQTTTAVGTSGGRQAVAENISQLEFRYLDNEGKITGNLADIRSILIFFLAAASNPDLNFNNTKTYSYTYTSPDGTSTSTISVGPYNDNLRRRLFVTTIQCRNLGLGS